jgi:CheY-like chemotaxis protein
VADIVRVNRRFGADRRKQPRGGRRPGDRPGYFPMIMVVERERGRRDLTETILMKLRFAVVPVESVEEALMVTRGVRPNVIVCPAHEAERIRNELLYAIPVVPARDEADALIEDIRVALRARVIPLASS